MTLEDLRKAIVALRINPRVVSINGAGADEEQYRLEQDSRTWIVYYYERGQQVEPRQFLSEAEACRYLLDRLEKDPTTRIGYPTRPA